MKPTHAPVIALAAAALLAAPAPQAAAAPQGAPALPAAKPAAAATPDYDGDGRADVAATMVDDQEFRFIRVWYGSGRVADIAHADLAADEYGIGLPLLARDLNGDGYTDLVASSSASSKVTVHLIPGSAAGLQATSRHSFVVLTKAKSHLQSLALVESPVRRLAVSTSTYIETSKGVRYDDQVLLYKLTGAGLPTGSPVKLAPGSGKVPAAMKGDFGGAMDSWGSQLFIGAPGAKVNGKSQAGTVAVVTLNSAGVKSVKRITQATRSVTGAVDKYDYFGNAVVARDGYLVVGTPGDHVGKVKRTGSIQVFSLSKGKVKPVKRISQNSAGIPGKAERLDRFGGHLAIGATCDGVPAVLVGGTGEAISKGHEGDGSAWLIPLRKAKGCAATQLYEGHGLPGKPDYRGIGDLLAFLRNRGEVADDLVIGGGGSFSEGPLGRIFRVSAKTGKATKLNPDDIFGAVTGR
ncbi:MAG: VCBS repeat-containing protein [Actinobacteria bacterium]|nr:VCBS repeat-containing protein [Actinomycetota bacterium]